MSSLVARRCSPDAVQACPSSCDVLVPVSSELLDYTTPHYSTRPRVVSHFNYVVVPPPARVVVVVYALSTELFYVVYSVRVCVFVKELAAALLLRFCVFA